MCGTDRDSKMVSRNIWYFFHVITSLVVEELYSLLLPAFSPTQYLALLMSIKQLENLSFYKLLVWVFLKFFGGCA